MGQFMSKGDAYVYTCWLATCAQQEAEELSKQLDNDDPEGSEELDVFRLLHASTWLFQRANALMQSRVPHEPPSPR